MSSCLNLKNCNTTAFKRHVLVCLFVMLFYLFFITISWDKVSIRIAGNTFRLTQLFLTSCFVIWLSLKISNEKFHFCVSGLVEPYLFLFALWCIGTDITSYNLKRSMMYSFWLIFSCLMVLIVVDYVGTSRKALRQLLRVYFYSFIVTSIVAFITSVLEYAGLLNLDVNPETGKEVTRGAIRMFGLCYEPSYFATYLITYLTTISYLQVLRSKILEELKHRKWHFYVVLIAFIGSFSRAGFVVFIPIVGILIMYEILRAIKFRKGKVSKWIIKAGFALVVFLSLAIFVLVSKASFVGEIDQYFFSGMGIGYHKNSAHSSGTRLLETAMTIQAGAMHPLMGVGMGGYGNFFVDNIKKFPLRQFWLAIALREALERGNKWHFLKMRAPEPMNVTAEVFATVGIPGLIIWLIINFIIPFRLIKLSNYRLLDSGMRQLLRGMAWGYVSLFVILHLNQNYMRPYYWLNIAMCCAVYLVAKSELFKGSKISCLKTS